MATDPLYDKLDIWAKTVDWSQYTLPKEHLVARVAGYIRDQPDYLLSLGANIDGVLQRVVYGEDKGEVILRALDVDVPAGRKVRPTLRNN